MRLASLLVGMTLLFLLTPSANAQFFGAAANSFDPQIDVVQSGVVLDAQATVSADRKYVTLTMRPSLSTLVALRDFTFQNGQNNMVVPGFVGLAQRPAPAAATPKPTGLAATAPQPLIPASPSRPNILTKEGMTQLNAKK